MATLQELLKKGISGPQTLVDTISGGMSNEQTIPSTTPKRARDFLQANRKPIGIGPLLNKMKDTPIIPAMKNSFVFPVNKKQITTSQNLNPSGYTPEDLAEVQRKISEVKNSGIQNQQQYPEYTGNEIPQFTGNDFSGGGSIGSGSPEGVVKFDITTFNPDDYFNIDKESLSNKDLYNIRKNITTKQKEIYSAAIDPQKLAQMTGGVFSPEMLRSLTQQAAKKYDQALDDIDATIEAREKTQAKSSTGFSAGAYDSTLSPYQSMVLRGTTDKDAPFVWNTFVQGYNNTPDDKKQEYLEDQVYTYLPDKKKIEFDAAQKAEMSLGSVISALQSGNVRTGPFINIGNQIARAVGTQDPNYEAIVSLFSGQTAEERLRLFGASLTKGEKDSARDFLPNKADTTAVLAFKINTLVNMAQAKRKEIIARQAGLSTKSINQEYLDKQKELLKKVQDGTLVPDKYGNVGNQSSSNLQSNIPEYEILLDGSIKIKKSFNNVGTDTKRIGSIRSVEDAMARIARNESDGQGGYFAIGPVVTSGQYKGERAIGKYQIMPGNVASWSKEYLGKTITPEELYRNPKYQDQIARGKMMQLYKQYGNWDDVASAWFTGRPLSQGSSAKDVLGTSGREYVNKFNA